MNNNISDIAKLSISIVVCQLMGFVGAFFTTPAINGWYQTINKPIFTPPNWLFAPVWTTLFLLMGVSFFLIWRGKSKNGEKKVAVIVFGIQFLFNILWSIVFFSLHSLLGGLIEIFVLWLMIWLTIITFCRVSRLAAYLLIPYVVWVTVAMILNFSIWLIN